MEIISLTYFSILKDILLNVFLAIAVDNLADAESLTNIEKEEEGVSIKYLHNIYRRETSKRMISDSVPLVYTTKNIFNTVSKSFSYFILVTVLIFLGNIFYFIVSWLLVNKNRKVIQ